MFVLKKKALFAHHLLPIIDIVSKKEANYLASFFIVFKQLAQIFFLPFFPSNNKAKAM